MPETRRIFLAYPFGDYEGVRARLDALARAGWELTGRGGIFTGILTSTRRKELYYDVVPALPLRSREMLQRSVEQRQGLGWEPVDTFWGMDIYKSRPCEYPAVERTGEMDTALRAVFLGWLVRAVLFTAVTLGVAAFRLNGEILAELGKSWYLSDGKTALRFLLPVVLTCWGLFLAWLVFCVFFRCRPHAPAGRLTMTLRGLVQLAGLACALLLGAALWVSGVPRLWLRLLFIAGAFLLVPLSRRMGPQWAAAGLMVLVTAGMVLTAALKPVGGQIGVDRGIVISPEAVDYAPDGSCHGYYGEEQSLLVRQRTFEQRWESGERLSGTLYRCLTPGIADLAEGELPRAGEQTLRRGRRVLVVTADHALSREAMEEILERLEQP